MKTKNKLKQNENKIVTILWCLLATLFLLDNNTKFYNMSHSNKYSSLIVQC